jgi:hypothetical protein
LVEFATSAKPHLNPDCVVIATCLGVAPDRITALLGVASAVVLNVDSADLTAAVEAASERCIAARRRLAEAEALGFSEATGGGTSSGGTHRKSQKRDGKNAASHHGDSGYYGEGAAEVEEEEEEDDSDEQNGGANSSSTSAAIFGRRDASLHGGGSSHSSPLMNPYEPARFAAAAVLVSRALMPTPPPPVANGPGGASDGTFSTDYDLASRAARPLRRQAYVCDPAGTWQRLLAAAVHLARAASAAAVTDVEAAAAVGYGVTWYQLLTSSGASPHGITVSPSSPQLLLQNPPAWVAAAAAGSTSIPSSSAPNGGSAASNVGPSGYGISSPARWILTEFLSPVLSLSLAMRTGGGGGASSGMPHFASGAGSSAAVALRPLLGITPAGGPLQGGGGGGGGGATAAAVIAACAVTQIAAFAGVDVGVALAVLNLNWFRF